MRRNSFEKIILLLMILNSLAACATLQAEEPVKDPLRVEYTQRWGDYTLLVAKEKGFFETYGVEVEPVYYDLLTKTYSDLASGQIDGALIAVGAAINIDRSAHMKVVAIHDNGGEDAVIVGPEINSIEDLKGKTIGMMIGSQYELTIVEMLRSVSMGVGDVIMLTVNPEESLKTLEEGQVQAAYTREPYLSEALSSGYKVIYPQEQLHLFPDTITFRKSIIDDRPEDVQAFLKAWFEAVDYRLQYPEETQTIAAKYLGVDIDEIQPDDNLKILTLDDNKKLFNLQEGNSIYAITKITSDYLISIGAAAQQIDPLELLDPDYLP